MIKAEDIFKIGTLGSAHGLKGEITLRYTDDIFTSDACDYLVCKVDGLLVPFFLEDWRLRNDQMAVVKFEGYDSAQAVAILHNSEVFYPKQKARGQQRELASWQMLTGFDVSEQSAGELGVVVQVDDSSANTLMLVRQPDGSELLLPIHPDLVVGIDLDERTLVLSLPEGMLNLN